MGAWSYDVIDTKLARETKAGSVLQLLVYADLLAALQGKLCDTVHIVRPWSNFQLETFRVADYAAYYREAKASTEAATGTLVDSATYPDPVEHCDVCGWYVPCTEQRRADDHLSLVAGLSKVQAAELVDNGVTTTRALSQLPIPIRWKPGRGSTAAFERVREQARLQVEARELGTAVLRAAAHRAGRRPLRPPATLSRRRVLRHRGRPVRRRARARISVRLPLYRRGRPAGLPTPTGRRTGRARRPASKQFVDFVIARRERHPDLHVYHYAPTSRPRSSG